MHQPLKIATRDSYGKELLKLGAAYQNVVVLDADLSEATKTSLFKKSFPERFFNTGIAECNMMSVAAGLASCGLTPFASTFAMFAAGRAFEQIRNSIGYPQLNVKIGATHGGISVGEDGASHQCNEDFALMRSIPGMTVICPSDDVEARAVVNAAYHHEGPVYMRFGRLATPVFHNESEYSFEIGKGELLRDGSDIAFIATGMLVCEALKAAEELSCRNISVMVINMPTIKPLDEKLVLAAAEKTGKIITAEEHSIIGGLGDAVCSLTAKHNPVQVERVGINDAFGHSGPGGLLMKEFGLSADHLVNKALEMLAR